MSSYDAKRPSEDINSIANIQQAYSYAIHPEVKSQHFALCNGHALAVFSVDEAQPLLKVDFADFEKRWVDIEQHLAPRFLLEPILRRFAPDLGFAFSRLSLGSETNITMLDVHLNTFALVDAQTISASANCDFAETPHMVSFDFRPDLLPSIVAGLPDLLRDAFLHALDRVPFQACADLMIVLDIDTKLGPETQGAAETFIPFLITKVMGSRFDPFPGGGEVVGTPAHIFRLSKAFTVIEPQIPQP